MKYENGDFYQVPRGIEKVVGDIYEFTVLTRLLDRASNTTGASFPSFRDLTMGMMCRNRAIQSVKAIEKLGIINIEHIPFKSNTYTINIDKLMELIKTSAPHGLVQVKDQSTTKTSQLPAVASQQTDVALQPSSSAPHAPPSAPDALPSAPHGHHDMHPNDNHSNNNHEQQPVIITSNENQNSVVVSVISKNNLTDLIVSDYEKRIGTVSPMLKTNIEDTISLYGPDMVLEAVDKAVAEGKTKWSAVKTTLMNWRDFGYRTAKGYCSRLSAAAAPIKTLDYQNDLHELIAQHPEGLTMIEMTDWGIKNNHEIAEDFVSLTDNGTILEKGDRYFLKKVPNEQ